MDQAIHRNRMHRFEKFILAGGILTSCASNAGWGSKIIPQLDLLVHFQVQYALTMLLCLLLLLYKRALGWAIIIALLLLFPLARIVPLYFSTSQSSVPPALNILCSNVRYTNKQYSSLLNAVNTIKPDVVIVQEATNDWNDALFEMHHNYPFRILNPESGPRGMLLFSKKPLIDPKAVIHPLTKHSTLSTTIQLGDSLVHLIAAHPFRPGLRHGDRILTKELKAITELVGINSEHTIVIGDLNTTMWSTTYIDFVNTCNLSNLRQGRGVLPSWSRIIPWISAIPIDHCLVGKGLEGMSFKLLPIEGSDHCAMHAVVQVAKTTD
ncbi:MAG: endonuclease/exonuclease/phosphatase family protein [Phycisphaerae bacterium]|nr:endonuclease/exonuclease/phosphatase family protein [Phycisphaerae bacterium]